MYKRLLNAITCGTKPTFVAESLGAVEYDVGEKGGLVNLTLYGSTNSKAKSGHPYNYNTYHVGTYDEEREGHFIKLRMRGEVFLDGEEFERLLALSSPQLYGGRSEDGRIIILTTTSNPSYIIPEGHFRSIKAPHTVNMDIQPESGFSGSNVCANLGFGYDDGGYNSWNASPSGTNVVHVTSTSASKRTNTIKGTRSHKQDNRFFIDPDTFCIYRANTAIPPIGKKCDPVYFNIPIREPLRSVIGADGTEYCDRYDVTRGRIERVVRKISISSIDDFEIVKDADKSYCYYKVNLPTPILNSAVESNMFKIYHGLDDVSGTNRIYVDPEGRFFIFKYFNEQPYEQQIKPLIDAAPFEFYWYDGNVTKEAVEPIRIKSKPGYSVMEVCEKCIPKISVEYRQ